ncbi:GGDEF domain-containing protein [Lysobacter hankyongensis]|uniref:diguanylate cyclase n=1 Tax=Lysobacter hankyongensis TaxID=1176535 RepID=A0ABP9CE78_9GAMM
MQWKRLVAVFVLMVVAIPVFAQTTEPFDAMLQKADAARSSDPKRFAELMEQLRADNRQITRLQRDKLKYLQAYEVGIYGDQLAKGAEMAKRLYDETGDPSIKYRAGGLVASFSAINRDLSTGLRYLQKAMAMRKQVPDIAIRHEGMANGALLYGEIGQHRIALRYADEVLADKPNERMRCIAGHHRLVSQFELGALPAQDGLIQSVVDQCAKQNERIAANIARSILARKFAADGSPDRAIALLEQMLPEVEATRYPRLIAGVHALIADLKLKLGDVKSAEEHAKMTVAMGEQIKSSATLVSAYNTLYRIAADREKPSVALDLYKRYAEAEMAHQSDIRARELAYEIVRHETKQQAAQLALERASTQKARLVAGLLLVMLGAIVFWVIQIKRHQGQLQRLAQTDTLTGLGNRHFFTQKSERALVDAARAGDSAALVMFDLDHFKAINDTYGHGAGDWVLKQVGKTCSAHCRKVDYLGRIGGEEFAVLLRGFDLAAAARLAEDCRSQLAQIDTRESGYSFVVTASFGVSSTAQSGYDLSRLLSHADQMLYRAKNEGRNRVCAYTAETAAEYKTPKRSPSLTVINS